MKYVIVLAVIVAIVSQTDLVKSFFKDANSSYTAFAKLAELYNNVEPKEQWSKAKCDTMNTIVDTHCSEFCTDGVGENCIDECKGDFHESFTECNEFK